MEKFGERERADGASAVGVVDVVAVGERIGRDVQDLFSRSILWSTRFWVTLVNRWNLLGGLVAAAGDEPLHLADRGRQIVQRGIQVGPAAVEHAGEGREPVLELNDLGVAVAQRRDEESAGS